MRSVEENKTEVFASLVYDGIFCFADESSVIMVYDWICREVWTTISTTQSSTGTMEAGEKWDLVHLLTAQLGFITLAEWKKATIHACNTTCRYLMPFFAPARCGIIWWGQTTLGVRAAARGRIMQSSRWESTDDRDHIMKDNGDSGAIMNVICMWQCDNCDIW